MDRVRPGYQWYRHCEILAEVLQRVADGKVQRLMVFMPPRHGKSELISRLFTAYFLYRYPDRWVGINSYAAELAYTLSRAARDHYTRAGGSIRDDAGAVKHWETGKGGGLWAAGVGGPITGKGWHLGVIDDPLKNAEEAASETIREKQKEWYGSTFYTREEPNPDTGDPNGALVVIQTRWHEDDLSGYLLTEEAAEDADGEPESWHIVNFEAIKEELPQDFPASCTVEPDFRKPGEALCPERRPLEKLRKIARRVGDYFWGALFQQRPVSKEGSFFKVGALKFIGPDEVPAELKGDVRAWDQAATEGAGDFTAGVRMVRTQDDRFIIRHVVRKQLSTDKRNATIQDTAEADGKGVRIHGNQDPGAAGVDQALAFTRMLTGFKVKTERVSGSKETRADPFSAQVNAGNVSLVRGPWNQAFIDELRSFPLGKHDDQVDAGADAFNELAGQPQRKPGWRGSVGGYA